MTKAKTAKSLFAQGYNCSQSVLLAFCEELGLDGKTAAKMALSFGGGMGGMRETCGALTGAFMALGLARGTGESPAPAEKATHYHAVSQLAEMFRTKNGSTLCRELLARGGKKICSELVASTAEILERTLQQSTDFNGSAVAYIKEDSK